MPAFTCTLEDIGSTDLPLVGGKGANLGELVGAGLPVPRAFCVTTDAYGTFLADSGLIGEILASLEGLDYESHADIDARASAIRDRLLDAPVPAAIEQAVLAAYAELEAELGADALVSVRSSATAEDLPGMSFAGQQDTYLNVAGGASVLEHVKRCWASLWTDRAIAYRSRQGFAHEEVLLAVVVQEMFPSQVSGILFTANPVTSNPQEMFLNSSWGLGEAVVSGRVDPDQFILDRRSLRVKEREIHEKLVMTAPGADGSGSVETEVPEERRRAPSLTDEIAELGTIGLRIEDHYGFPQDIEWGLADGRFAILQAREITAADLDFGMDLEAWQSPEARASLTDERWVWSRAYSDEVQTGSTTPFFYTDIQPRMTDLKINAMLWTETPETLGFPAERFREIPYFRWYAARAYYNLAWERERIRMYIPPFARDEAALWPFPVEEREAIRNMPFNWIRFAWIMVKLHVSNPNISLLGTTSIMYENLEKWTDYELGLWDALDLESASTQEILATREKARNASSFLSNVILPFTIYLYVLPAAMRTALERWCDDESQTLYNRLSAGLNTKTSEENIALWAVSREIRASETLTRLFREEDDVQAILAALPESEDGRAFQQTLDALIAKYGHRGGAERDSIHPRWRHRPELVFHALKPMLAVGDEEDPARNEERLRERMLDAKEVALARAGKGPLGLLKAPVLKWLIGLTQDYIYYRDFERFWNDRTMSRPRDLYTAIARKLIKRDLMQDEEDIFFLGREEVLAAEDGRMSAHDIAVRVRARRRVYEKYSHREPPKYVQGWRAFDDDQLPDDGKGLRGIPASSGTVTGRARVCRRIEEVGKVGNGDILVTVATDPAWTTVFSFIGGVVVESGGVVAHAVMISREYGLPCVAHLTRACDLIPDGALITVDGMSGRVVIHDEPVAEPATAEPVAV
jgi:phosphohistidine swiveling domain-containing protein